MKFMYIFMILLTLLNLSACTRQKYSVYYPDGYEYLNLKDVNLLYLDSNYNSSENKTDMMAILFKNMQDIIIFSEKESDNEYLVSIISKDNTSVLMRYKNKKIFPETVSFHKNGTVIKGLVKMDLIDYSYADITFYMDNTMELISSIKLDNDIKNYKDNVNLDKDENYNLNIMRNILFILNSINNHIMNNGQVQTRGRVGTIFKALGTMIGDIGRGVLIALGFLGVVGLVVTVVVVPIAKLIIESIEESKKSKKMDEKFVINYKNSSALILKDGQDIIFDGDSFGINNTLNLVLPVKYDLAPIKWYIKDKPDSMNYGEVGQYFLFRNYNNTPIGVKPDGLIVNLIFSEVKPEATFYLQYEKIKNLQDGESVIICFEFANKAVINGYYTDNICMEIK